MELTYTDEEWNEIGVIRDYSLDMAYGDDENDFELTLSAGMEIPVGGLVFADETEYGGIVRKWQVSTFDDSTKRIYSGDTWHGILDKKILCPPDGSSHYVGSGYATEIMSSVLEYIGMDGVFSVEDSTKGGSGTFTFDRYCTVYAGFKKLCSYRGLKMKVTKPIGGKPTVYVEEAASAIDDGSMYGIRYKASKNMPTNHLVCLGEGEDESRVVLHLYADGEGLVSDVQTFTGVDEIAEVYDYNNDDAEQLLEDGTSKLLELQEIYSAELELPEGTSFDVGDSVGIFNDDTGLSVVSTVSKVIVNVNEQGVVKVSNELTNTRIGV